MTCPAGQCTASTVSLVGVLQVRAGGGGGGAPGRSGRYVVWPSWSGSVGCAPGPAAPRSRRTVLPIRSTIRTRDSGGGSSVCTGTTDRRRGRGARGQDLGRDAVDDALAGREHGGSGTAGRAAGRDAAPSGPGGAAAAPAAGGDDARRPAGVRGGRGRRAAPRSSVCTPSRDGVPAGAAGHRGLGARREVDQDDGGVGPAGLGDGVERRSAASGRGPVSRAQQAVGASGPGSGATSSHRDPAPTTTPSPGV